MKLLDINAKVDKIMKNPYTNFFIIMNLIIIISCYSLLNDDSKYEIKYFISNPIITILSIICIIILGYFNINIAILCLVLLFIILYTYPNSKNSVEGFTDEDNTIKVNSFEDVKSIKKKYSKEANLKINKSNKEALKKFNKNNEDSVEKKVNSLAKIFTDQLHAPQNQASNEFKKGILENKQKLLELEKEVNSNKNSKSKKKKENFQTVDTRSFDPSNEVDTNLLITKEILQDMINRIEYNYETVPYLKKYLRHRLEEIIDINKLLQDDEE